MRGPRHELHADQARYLDGVKFKPNSKAYQKYKKNMCNKMRPRIASLLMFVRAHDMSAGDGSPGCSRRTGVMRPGCAQTKVILAEPFRLRSFDIG